eukprot:UN33539
MKNIHHPNVVNFYAHFASKSHIFIVIEYCDGGDLLEYLNERGKPISEFLCKKFMCQLLGGLEYLHGQGICHRDIKPENLLLNKARDTMKIADFGLSKQICGNSNQIFVTYCGSLTHIAPEIFVHDEEKGYDQRVDIWSAGVVLYVMLSVSYPFDDPNRADLIDKIQSGKFAFEEEDAIWNRVSKEAKDLI